jgi:peptidoglycan/LPS O-acetylase OafA/YrhL
MLRGVAILAVLAFHIPHYAPGGWRNHPFFFVSFFVNFGYLGVPLFILISGFCIHGTVARNRRLGNASSFSWIAFWRRRFVRLYPPYAIAVVVTLACALLTLGFAGASRYLGWDLATHLLLVHNLTAEYAISLGNGPFWSLGTEEQLYGLYALLLYLMAKGTYRIALVVSLAVTLCFRVAEAICFDCTVDVGPFHLGEWYRWPFPYWFHWVLGAVSVDAYYENVQLPQWAKSALAGVAGVASGLVLNANTVGLLTKAHLAPEVLAAMNKTELLLLTNVGDMLVLIGCFCLLNWVLRKEAIESFGGLLARSLAVVGTFSYSLYLVHVPIISLLNAWVPLGNSPMEWAWRYILYGTLSIAGGFCFFLCVERWFLTGRLPATQNRVGEKLSAT